MGTWKKSGLTPEGNELYVGYNSAILLGMLGGDTSGILHDWPFVRITSRNTHGSPVSTGSRWLLFVPSSHLFLCFGFNDILFLK